MIEEDFYATVKLKSGEEIFAKVAASEEEGRTMLLISNPIVVDEIKTKHGVVGYKVEPWLKTTTEDMFIININDVLTLSESFDVEMIMMYQNYVRQSDSEGSDDTSRYKLSQREMGYISSVADAKEVLEKIFNKG